MIKALNKKGYDAFSISIPSVNDLVTIFRVAAPVFVMMMSKVNSPSWLDSWFRCILWFHFLMGFRFLYAADSLLCIDNLYCYIYGYICCGCSSGLFSGSLVHLILHTFVWHGCNCRFSCSFQVMIQTFCMCTVWGEPLCQAALSFMPELMYGINRSLSKVSCSIICYTVIVYCSHVSYASSLLMFCEHLLTIILRFHYELIHSSWAISVSAETNLLSDDAYDTNRLVCY